MYHPSYLSIALRLLSTPLSIILKMLSWNETLTNVGRSWPASCKSHGDFSWVLWFQWTKPRWWKNALQQQVLPMPSLNFLRLLFFLLIFFPYFFVLFLFRLSYLGNMSSTYWFIYLYFRYPKFSRPPPLPPSLLPFAITFKISALELLREDGESWRTISRVDGLSALYYQFSLFLFLSPSLAGCPR